MDRHLLPTRKRGWFVQHERPVRHHDVPSRVGARERDRAATHLREAVCARDRHGQREGRAVGNAGL